jgi:hypothetical protein
LEDFSLEQKFVPTLREIQNVLEKNFRDCRQPKKNNIYILKADNISDVILQIQKNRQKNKFSAL